LWEDLRLRMLLRRSLTKICSQFIDQQEQVITIKNHHIIKRGLQYCLTMETTQVNKLWIMEAVDLLSTRHTLTDLIKLWTVALLCSQGKTTYRSPVLPLVNQAC